DRGSFHSEPPRRSPRRVLAAHSPLPEARPPMQHAPERPGAVRPIRKRPSRKLPFPFDLYQTAVGKKWVMALTGIALLGYVVAHMVGNLKLYYGPADMNAYGDWLRHLGYPVLKNSQALWLLRTGLIVAFILHLHSAYSLTVMNRQARPVGYQRSEEHTSELQSRENL